MLIGKWALIEKINNLDSDIELIEIEGSSSKTESKTILESYLIFKKDKTVLINQQKNKYEANFKLIDSLLIIGNSKYIIVKIDKENLIFKDKDGLFDIHYQYEKIK